MRVPGIFFSILLLTVLVMGCGGSKQPNTSSSTQVSQTTQPVTTTSPVTPGVLFLELTSPADKSIVTGAEITVNGQSLPTAIVSVNGNLVKINPDGTFSIKVPLELGPNAIQILASEIGGGEVGKVIAVGRTS